MKWLYNWSVLTFVLSSNISDYLLDKKKYNMKWQITRKLIWTFPINTKELPCKINRRFYLTSGDREFSNQFSVHFFCSVWSFLWCCINRHVGIQMATVSLTHEHQRLICSTVKSVADTTLIIHRHWPFSDGKKALWSKRAFSVDVQTFPLATASIDRQLHTTATVLSVFCRIPSVRH